MKKNLLLILTMASISAFSQVKEISRSWTSFKQSKDASFIKKKTKFKLTASAKTISTDTTSWCGLWARVDNKNGETGFFDNMGNRRIRNSEWTSYTIEGTMDENSDEINFGGICIGNGQFYFDNFELYVENEKGKLQKADFNNASFEDEVLQNIIPLWLEGTSPQSLGRVKEFTFSSSRDKVHGNLSLSVEGKGIKKDTTNLIGPIKGFSPQIGTLITMLNNLSMRVERSVALLNEQEVDHLMDEKANRIGALIMHLAAVEAYYQVYTFENRDFNEEEKKKWQSALDLEEEARKEFKGHDIEYYLNIYKDVRKKTIEELAKRNDEWLAQVRPGSDINNHFRWFHVTEHQSSHLGQILLMKKRLPKREEKIKVNIEH
jgi:hypothetical protein